MPRLKKISSIVQNWKRNKQERVREQRKIKNAQRPRRSKAKAQTDITAVNPKSSKLVPQQEHSKISQSGSQLVGQEIMVQEINVKETDIQESISSKT